VFDFFTFGLRYCPAMYFSNSVDDFAKIDLMHQHQAFAALCCISIIRDFILTGFSKLWSFNNKNKGRFDSAQRPNKAGA
jgi:hypothetical protein